MRTLWRVAPPATLWINATGAIGSGFPIGPTIRTQRAFDLTGYDLSTVSLVGKVAVMDSNLGLYLNGNLLAGSVLLYPSTNPWQFLTNFSVASASGWFYQGMNTLEFQTTTVNSVYDGVLVEQADVMGSPDPSLVTPEPTSCVQRLFLHRLGARPAARYCGPHLATP